VTLPKNWKMSPNINKYWNIITCHLSASPGSMVAAPSLVTVSRHCCRFRLMCTTSLRDKPLVSVMFVMYEIGGLPLFLLASIFPWSTVVIRFVFVFLFIWPKYLSFLLFIVDSSSGLTDNSSRTLSFVLFSVHWMRISLL